MASLMSEFYCHVVLAGIVVLGRPTCCFVSDDASSETTVDRLTGTKTLALNSQYGPVCSCVIVVAWLFARSTRMLSRYEV